MKLFELKVKPRNATTYRIAVRHAVKTDLLPIINDYLKKGYCVKVEPLQNCIIEERKI